MATSTLLVFAFIGLFVLLLVVGAVFLVLNREDTVQASPSKTASKVAVQYRRKSVLTETERKFLAVLTEAAPSVLVVPQLAMSALVDVTDEFSKGKYAHVNRSRISQQRLDFVLMSRDTQKVYCVVELDDKSHDTKTQKTKDLARDAILASVGYRVVRVDARDIPNVPHLRSLLRID